MNDGETMTFLDEGKEREFVISRLILKECLKKFLETGDDKKWNLRTSRRKNNRKSKNIV